MIGKPDDLFDSIRRIAESLRRIAKSTENMSEATGLTPLQLAGFRKYGDWLYAAEYNNIDYEYAKAHYDSRYLPGACTAVRNGDIIGRNFDWYYNEDITMVTRTAPGSGRYEVLGICTSAPRLVRSLAESGKLDEAYRIAPFYLTDGINSEGLYCNINVVTPEASKGRTTGTVPTVERRDKICMTMLPRYILDHYATVDAAIDGLQKYVSIYAPDSEVYSGEFHFMLADGSKTVILEFVNNAIKATEVGPEEDYPGVMVNFYVDGVTVNDDGTITRNVSEDGNANGVTPFGQGIERHNIAVAGLADADDVAGMKTLMRSLFYTKAYTLESNKWYTEFTGDWGDLGTTTVSSATADFATIMEKASAKYTNRSRTKGDPNFGTWQTTHSVVYDLENMTLDVCVQEGDDYKSFTF